MWVVAYRFKPRSNKDESSNLIFPYAYSNIQSTLMQLLYLSDWEIRIDSNSHQLLLLFDKGFTNKNVSSKFLPVVILPLIYSGSLFISAIAAKGIPQFATKTYYYQYIIIITHDSVIQK